MPGTRHTKASLFCDAVKDLLVEADLRLKFEEVLGQSELPLGGNERQWNYAILENIWREVDNYASQLTTITVPVKVPEGEAMGRQPLRAEFAGGRYPDSGGSPRSFFDSAPPGYGRDDLRETNPPIN